MEAQIRTTDVGARVHGQGISNMNFVFESAVPGLLPEEEVMRRLSLWKLAKVNFVALQIHDGQGATWDSTFNPIHPRSTRWALPKYIDLMHANGIKVLLVYNVAGVYDPRFPDRPEFLLSGMGPGLYFYNMWDPNFVDWRVSTLVECLNKVDADAVSLDYLRSGREAINEELPADVAVKTAISAFRNNVSCPMLNMTNAFYLTRTRPLQGIDIKSWAANDFFDEWCFFNYNTPWPVMITDTGKTHALGANYNHLVSPVTAHSGRTITSQRAKLLRAYPRMKSYGLYLANLMTEDQARAMSRWDDTPNIRQWI